MMWLLPVRNYHESPDGPFRGFIGIPLFRRISYPACSIEFQRWCGACNRAFHRSDSIYPGRGIFQDDTTDVIKPGASVPMYQERENHAEKDGEG
jgi:hypothetical protein